MVATVVMAVCRLQDPTARSFGKLTSSNGRGSAGLPRMPEALTRGALGLKTRRCDDLSQVHLHSLLHVVCHDQSAERAPLGRVSRGPV